MRNEGKYLKRFLKILLVIIVIGILCSSALADVISYEDNVVYENYPEGTSGRQHRSQFISAHYKGAFMMSLFIVLPEIIIIVIIMIVNCIRKKKNINKVLLFDIVILILWWMLGGCYLGRWSMNVFYLWFAVFNITMIIGSILTIKDKNKVPILVSSILVFAILFVPKCVWFFRLIPAFTNKAVDTRELIEDIETIKNYTKPSYAHQITNDDIIEGKKFGITTYEGKSIFVGYQGDGYFIKYDSTNRRFTVLVNDKEIYSFKVK